MDIWGSVILTPVYLCVFENLLLKKKKKGKPEKKREFKFPSTGLLPKCPEQLELGQVIAEVRKYTWVAHMSARKANT